MQAEPTEERVIWEGTPSQWLNFRRFVFTGILALVVVALYAVFQGSLPSDQRGAVIAAVLVVLLILALGALQAYLQIRFLRYTMTTERVRIARGIFTRRTDELELYRVDDAEMVEPFLLRLVRRGNINLVTADPTNPRVVLRAIPTVAVLRDQLRHYREICRQRKGTRVVDFANQ